MADGFPFIPSALDELGLDVYAFRVYAHACRRAGPDGLFYGGGVNVARTCCMSLRQLRRAVDVLRTHGLLEVVAASCGRPTTYRPVTAYQCPTGTGTSAPQAPVEGGPVPDRHSTSAPQAHPPVPDRHTKVLPLKVLPEGIPSDSPAARQAARTRAKRSKAKGTTTATAARKETAAPWTREACDDWIARFQGTAPGGRIGKALKPLVTKHGWSEVREAWRNYLQQTEPEYASAEKFASTFGCYVGPAPRAAKATPTDRVLAAASRFIAGEKP